MVSGKVTLLEAMGADNSVAPENEGNADGTRPQRGRSGRYRVTVCGRSVRCQRRWSLHTYAVDEGL